ncbi:4615_t:CDS:2 [Funneliformis caledonium]|uniref:4615_t:CDS:1 n=1 Tax=Funneliformis caledonium TaxID=1117310 RepID=A0A9N9HWK9_9GLOM|nr:4615_t:CDS:2 [Funneliformis caledonium]
MNTQEEILNDYQWSRQFLLFQFGGSAKMCPGRNCGYGIEELIN